MFMLYLLVDYDAVKIREATDEGHPHQFLKMNNTNKKINIKKIELVWRIILTGHFKRCIDVHHC